MFLKVTAIHMYTGKIILVAITILTTMCLQKMFKKIQKIQKSLALKFRFWGFSKNVQIDLKAKQKNVRVCGYMLLKIRVDR